MVSSGTRPESTTEQALTPSTIDCQEIVLGRSLGYLLADMTGWPGPRNPFHQIKIGVGCSAPSNELVGSQA